MSQILAAVYRGKTVESVHCGSVAVVDNRGKLLFSCGDPNFFTFLRSSAKPFQLLPLIESGAATHFNFTPRELAIMAGSHSGSPRHVNLVKRILNKIGLSAKYLRCGVHVPFHYASRGISPSAKLKFSSLHHNCSGKHAGMLAVCQYLGWNLKNYLHPSHPLQKRILKRVSEVCHYPASKIKIGVDGCSAPNFALPLKNMAWGFAELVSSRKGDALYKVSSAMQKFPEMVSGQRRLDFQLAQAAGSKLLSKGGAEGLECIGLLDSDTGVAVRVQDGNSRAVGCAAAETLRQLGILKKSDLDKISKFAYPKIKNDAGKTVGFIRPEFKLKEYSLR